MAGLTGDGYSKAKGAGAALINRLIPRVADAVKNADLLAGQREGETFPVNPSTSVQALVYSLHEALPDEMRRRFPLPGPDPRP